MEKNIGAYTITVTKCKFFKYKSWFFYYRKYNYIKGFIFRVFGFHFNIREKDSLQKLINIHRNQSAKINLTT